MTPDEAYGEVLESVRDHVGMTYAVAVPSYRRADKLTRCTLPMLDRLQVDRDRVTVFVADDAEAEQYREAVAGDWRVVVARPGLYECRHWYLTEHYPQDTPVLNFDDDLSDIVVAVDGRLRPATSTVDQIAAIGFGACAAVGARMWGITTMTNARFLRDELLVGLRCLPGVVCGNYAGEPCFDSPPHVPVHGDSYRTLKAYAACGSVVRLEWLSVKTQFSAPGGIAARFPDREARDRAQSSSVRRMVLEYPQWASVNTVWKSGQKTVGSRIVRFKPITALRVPRASLERLV